MKFPWTKKRYSATARRELTEYAGEQYTIVELFVPQRMVIGTFSEENKSGLLVMAFIVSLGCEQFIGEDPADLAIGVAPGCLEHLSQAIIKMNGLGVEQEQEIEKKSESNPS